MTAHRTWPLLIFITALLVAGLPAGSTAAEGERLTVEAIYGTEPVTGDVPSDFQWSPDGTRVSFLLEVGESTELRAVDLATGKPHILAVTMTESGDPEADQDLVTAFAAHHWSPDGTRILVETGEGLFLFHLEDSRWQRLTDGDAAESDPQFSPDGNRLALVRDQNLFVIDLLNGRERQLTTDGGGPILNGEADWVHREELDLDSGYAWSPDGRRIAFLRYDQTAVRQWPLMNYDDEDPTVTLQYYPRPGEANATVTVGVTGADGGGVHWIDPGRGTDGEWILARFHWLPDSERLALQRLSRDQKRLDLLVARADGTGDPAVWLTETDPHWVNVSDHLRFLADGGFIWSSEADGWRHFHRYPAGGGSPVRLTGGAWPVDDLVGLDEENGLLYFTAGRENPLGRRLHRVGLDGAGLTTMSRAPGWHTITMAPGCAAFVDEHSAVTRPPRFSLHRADGSELGIVHEGAGSALRRFRLRRPEFIEVTADDGARLPAALLLPPGMSRSRRYPAVVYTYGGPHAQVVRDAWSPSMGPWLQLMAQRGFVVFWLDNRGAARRGAAWERVVDRRLGERELKDQLCGLRHLRSLPFVDPERVGIFGWSYGGTMVLNAMLRSPGSFAAGAAVAPVTDWREYDTLYTERYMGLPAENEKGYQATAPVNHAKNLEGKLLLAHGTADDNVHFRNTAKMLAALNEAGKAYELAVYPGKGHSIRGNNVRPHIFNRLTRFFTEALEPERTPPRETEQDR